MSQVPFNGLANQLQQIVNQFVGRRIDDHLKAQIKASVENLLHQSLPDPYNYKVTVDNNFGNLHVNVDPVTIPVMEPYTFNKRSLYKSSIFRPTDHYYSNSSGVLFIYDPRDVDEETSDFPYQFYLY